MTQFRKSCNYAEHFNVLAVDPVEAEDPGWCLCVGDGGVAERPAGLRARRFNQFGAFDNVSICGASTYPCGSVAGTPGYLCVSELLRYME